MKQIELLVAFLKKYIPVFIHCFMQQSILY